MREVPLVAQDEGSRRRQPDSPPDLRPIVSRLQEIQRKCRSLRTRNDETLDASARLDAVLGALEAAGDGEGSQRPRYRELARQLFRVEHLFESLGFASVAREVAYVERTLESLEPGGPSVDGPRPRSASSPTPFPDAGLEASAAPAGEEETPRQRRLPRPLAGMLLVLLLVIVGAIVAVRMQSGKGLPITSGLGDATPAAPVVLPVATPARAPVAPSAPGPAPTPAEPHGGAVVAEEIAQARLAIAEGDLDRAIHHVSRAALVDLTSSLVLDTGRTIVDELLARSDAAADGGHWEEASTLLSRARELSIRFGFPLAPVNAAEGRHDSMERFQLVAPGDRQTLAAAIGRRALLLLDNGQRREGRIQGVDGGTLHLERYTEVRSRGKVYYTEDIPLDEVREIRVYQD